MLTIRDKLPVKKLVLYGSTAILVGFAGTYTVLREIFPYDRRDNLADANLERKQAARGNAIKPAETSDDKSTDTSEDALKESGMLVSEAPNATQPSSNAQAPAALSSNDGPITATPSVTPVPTPVAPADVTPTPAPQPVPVPVADDPVVPPVVPLIESTTEIIIDGVVQP